MPAPSGMKGFAMQRPSAATRPMSAERRQLLRAGSVVTAAAALYGLGLARPARAGAARVIEVWKDEGCGCCKDWIAHMAQHGFEARTHDGGNSTARARLGLPVRYGSCHTAQVGGYVIEGHVPAADVQRLLREAPAQALGLAVPGMPIGSPGMDGPAYGNRRDRFDVLLVMKDGSHRVFSSYPARTAG